MRLSLHRLDPRALAWMLLPFFALALGVGVVQETSRVRLLFFALLVFGLFVVSTVDPRQAILALFALLPFLGVGRRLLIPVAGWSTRDPLVLIGAAVLGLLLIRIFVIERRPLSGSRLSQLVLALVFITLLESINPRGGGLSAGLGGFAYVGVPILWFFVGRELLDEQTTRRLLWLTVPLGAVIGTYGLFQVSSGLPSWDESWVKVTGYNALFVGSKIRPFGTFPSSDEYATYLAVGIVVAVAFCVRGRSSRNVLGLLAVPLLAVAMFYESSRGIIVLTAFALFVMIGLTTGSTRKAIAAVVVGVALAGVGLHLASGSLNAKASSSNTTFVSHQVGGLTHPLNTQQSTLVDHYNLFSGGISAAFRAPLGTGTASISKGGQVLGGAGQGTEASLSDAFLGLGVVGGVLFSLLMLAVAAMCIRVYLTTRSNVALAACGVLVVTGTQWLNGDLYTVTPLVWVLIGWLARTDATAAPVSA